MRKKIIAVLMAICTLSPLSAPAQSYGKLWEKVNEAEEADLPQTQRKHLSEIVRKAEQEKRYGHLLKALLKDAQVACDISPDSLAPFIKRLTNREQQTTDTALQAIFQTVLSRIYADHPRLNAQAAELSASYRAKAMSHPDKLASVKASDYVPLLMKGEDSHFFGDDLLSAIGYETGQYRELHQYYLTTANREAQLLSGIEWLKAEGEQMKNTIEPSDHLARIDSLMDCYADIPVCGEAAIARYEYMAHATTCTAEERVAYIDQALKRWGSWKRIELLRNYRKQLTMRMFEVQTENRLTIPDRKQTLRLVNLRNIQSLTMTVYRVNSDAHIRKNPNNERDYKELKPLLTALPHLTQTKTFANKKDYELFSDSMLLEGLPVGVYLLEFKSNPQTEVSRSLFFVSNVRLLSLALPGNKQRYVVVNGTTGQPISGATLQFTLYQNGRHDQTKTITLTSGVNGECQYDWGKDRVSEVFVHTATDSACPATDGRGYFNYYGNNREFLKTAIYTDRAIYRPGQKVQMSAILYTVRHGYEHDVAAGKKVNASLRDANYQIVEERELVTDAYGVVTASFTLPAKGLTGHYSLTVNGQSQYFRVEEYKRPTFQVEFPSVNQEYQDGDTLTIQASAKSYAGVPVQSACVKYSVERRAAWWWISCSRYSQGGFIGPNTNSEKVYSGETMTDTHGLFEVKMPMVLPKSRFPQFYHFVVVADVTDAAGETHQGQLSLPLGSQKAVLTIDLDEKVLAEKKSPMTLHLLNAAGNDMNALVRYRFDGGKWKETASNTPVELPKLKSGRHLLQAVCGEDTLERPFVVFSLHDKRPAVDTDDWFYVSANEFPNASDAVTLQAGSSADHTYIFYTIVAGDKVIEQGAVDKKNEIINRQFTYKEEYGNGLTISLAWIREGKSHIHSAEIRRPLPDKRLRLKWETFRNRLIPGQEEEWKLSIRSAAGDRMADASLMATLYDKSLDQLSAHGWELAPFIWLPMASMHWYAHQPENVSCAGRLYPNIESVSPLEFWHFDESCFPTAFYNYYNRARIVGKAMVKSSLATSGVTMEAADGVMLQAAESVMADEKSVSDATTEDGNETSDIQIRENLQETAFFFPQLLSDSTGNVSLKFTLPESLTTWRFMGLAHTKDMMYGLLEDEAVAKKDVMIQPNVPRFLRMGDKATLSARIFNTANEVISGKVRLILLDAESEAVVYDEQQPCTLKPDSTLAVQFEVACSRFNGLSMLVCRMMVSGESFSDGEQHYLPILPNRERVTMTVPFIQTEAGTKTIDLQGLIPHTTNDTALSPRLTVEYTNNPAWLMILSLPSIAHAHDNCAICQATSFYANSLGRHILKQNPRVKHIFEMWKQDDALSALQSSLKKNEELKDLVLTETPWVMDANHETAQREQLADFFDDTQMNSRLSAAVEHLQKLQNADGSWSWWNGMRGSFYITVEISEMLVRLHQMTGTVLQSSALGTQLNQAFGFMDKEIVELVKEMKKEEKKGHKPSFPSQKVLQYLYISTLDGRQPSSQVIEAQTYLKKLLRKESRALSIYDKAMAAIVLNSTQFLKSLHEWTTYKEGVGRYYDTPRAGYSWRDYRIPTQVAVIEAFKRLRPNDQKTIWEMQQWLLHEKRAQAWDTPINSIDAIYAFLEGQPEILSAQPKTVLKIDGTPLITSDVTAGIGYVKTAVPVSSQAEAPKSLTAEKTSTGVSWGAVYAQFMQDSKEIADQGSEISVKREIFMRKDGKLSPLDSSLKVGDRITVRLTIESERDLDFVEVIDKRAACMEPVNQLSGYHRGYYCAPKDHATHYFFDVFRKGQQVIESEYYIDRSGQYETGTCVVQCAYAPEFRGTTHSQTLHITE